MASRYECPDRIEWEQLPDEMTVGQLESYISLMGMCDWCDGCKAGVEWLKRELQSRSPEERQGYEKNRQRLRAQSAVNMTVGDEEFD